VTYIKHENYKEHSRQLNSSPVLAVSDEQSATQKVEGKCTVS